MTPETLAALEASIARWHDKVEMAKTDEGILEIEISGGACPLCHLFREPFPLDPCARCPVLAGVRRHEHHRSRGRLCRGTPYSDAADAYISCTSSLYAGEGSLADREIARSVFRSAARREIRFLTSLLPPAATRDDIVGEAGLGWGRAA